MTGAIAVMSGVVAVPSASWLKFATLGNNGVDEYGFRGAPNGGPFGSVQYTNRIGGVIVSQFAYVWTTDSFTFEIDESSLVPFDYTQLLVEDFTANLITFTKASAVQYSGFPLKGWVWSATPGGGPLWTLASVGTIKRIYVQR